MPYNVGYGTHSMWTNFNIVVMAKALFNCSSNVNHRSQSTLRHNQQCDSCTIDSEFQQQTAPRRIYIKFNKCLFIVVCFHLIRNNSSGYNKPLTGFDFFTTATSRTRWPADEYGTTPKVTHVTGLLQEGPMVLAGKPSTPL